MTGEEILTLVLHVLNYQSDYDGRKSAVDALVGCRIFNAEELVKLRRGLRVAMSRGEWDELTNLLEVVETANPSRDHCKCGYPTQPCLRKVLRNGPPYPTEPCEPQ